MYTEKAKETFARVLHLYVIFAGLISMGISVFTPEVLLILTTPKYYQAASVASILSFSYFFIGLTYIADIGSAIAKKTAPLGFITTVSSGMVLLFNFIFVPAYGKEGAAFAVCLAQLIPPIYMFYRSQKLYYIPYNFTKVIMTGAIIILFAITGRVISDEFLWSVFLIKVLLCIVLMGVFYFINRRVIHTFVKTTILRS
jgi:O-antigen/teichoic acid export membrane protein